jgi:hypothetical protein
VEQCGKDVHGWAAAAAASAGASGKYKSISATSCILTWAEEHMARQLVDEAGRMYVTDTEALHMITGEQPAATSI